MEPPATKQGPDPLLWSQHTILEREVRRAEGELKRPANGLLLSGVIAGIGVSISPVLVAVVLTLAGDAAAALSVRLVMAIAYSVGFIVVIMGHTDLFTEYSTMALLPVLSGEAPVTALARLWGLVYVGNLLGVAIFSALLVPVAPRLGVVEQTVFVEMARRLIEHPFWVIFVSALLTGWLMGLLSWLISASGDTVSQILLVGLVASAIGFLQLHHAIAGCAEVLMGLWAGDRLTWKDGAHFLVWTTVGNAFGGVVFAVMIRYSVVIGGSSNRRTPRGAERS